MSGSYDAWQTTFVLSMKSNAVMSSKGDQQALANELYADLADPSTGFFNQANTQQYIGQWEVVWGPAIYQAPKDVGGHYDNAMYVAANADKSVYVVAIAATNGSSMYDWMQEDAGVNQTYAWPAAGSQWGLTLANPSGPAPYLSAGTTLGIKNLLCNMPDLIQSNPTHGQSLLTFLTNLCQANQNLTTKPQLIFTGHSLAGALSPTLAMALFNPNGGPLNTYMSNWSNVYVYPTAGATPGNAGFASYFSTVFPQVVNQQKDATPQAYQKWNTLLWNSLDVVPHAWLIALLEEIPKLYTPPYDVVPSVVLLKDWAVKRSNDGAATGAGPYTQLINQSLPGKVNPLYPVKDLESFLVQLLYQHISAYKTLIPVLELMPDKKDKELIMALVDWILAHLKIPLADPAAK